MNLEKKICKPHNCFPKMISHTKFHPNWTMGKCSKLGRKLEMVLTDVENQRYSKKTSTLRLSNFSSKRNFDKGFGISFVITMDISSHTESEQPRIAGK